MLTDPRQLMAPLIALVWLLVLPGDAVAQAGAQKPLSMDRQPARFARVWPLAVAPDSPSLGVPALTVRAQSAQRGRSRDSLKNGTIIGAVVGAVALGTFAAVLCNAQQEPGGPSCLKDTLRIAAVGAAIGAGAGLAVDAALTQRQGVSVSVAIRF